MSDYKVHIHNHHTIHRIREKSRTYKVKKDGPQALGNEESLFFITDRTEGEKKKKHVERFTFNGK